MVFVYSDLSRIFGDIPFIGGLSFESFEEAKEEVSSWAKEGYSHSITELNEDKFPKKIEYIKKPKKVTLFDNNIHKHYVVEY